MSDDQRAPQWGDEPAPISKQELMSTALAAFGIGCLVGWALFGSPRQIDRVLDSESLANWIAALGTWVVGYMAWRIARDGEKQRKAERQKVEKEAFEARVARRFSVINKVGRLKKLHEAADTLSTDELPTFNELHMQVGLTLDVIANARVTADERLSLTAAE